MPVDHQHTQFHGIPVEIRRKHIKHMYVGVYPPDGRVRVSAPLRLGLDAIRRAVVSRIPWIRRKQEDFRRRHRESESKIVTGEYHALRGMRYRLDVIERVGRPDVRIAGNAKLELKVRPGTGSADRRKVLERWYRKQLKALLPALIDLWSPVVGVEVAEWRVKRMKTRWGTCNISARRIWLNLELIKKPPACLEYVLVHEMVHLLERNHTARFRALMDKFMPDWRLRRDELNRSSLAPDDWNYRSG